MLSRTEVVIDEHPHGVVALAKGQVELAVFQSQAAVRFLLRRRAVQISFLKDGLAIRKYGDLSHPAQMHMLGLVPVGTHDRAQPDSGDLVALFR